MEKVIKLKILEPTALLGVGDAHLKLLESVMPCDGAAALIITSPERAKSISKRPAYILGVGLQQGEANIWQREKFTETPAVDSAKRALAMAGYQPSDIEFAEFYD